MFIIEVFGWHQAPPYNPSPNHPTTFCLQPVSAHHMDSAMKEFMDQDGASVKLDGLDSSVKPKSV